MHAQSHDLSSAVTRTSYHRTSILLLLYRAEEQRKSMETKIIELEKELVGRYSNYVYLGNSYSSNGKAIFVLSHDTETTLQEA